MSAAGRMAGKEVQGRTGYLQLLLARQLTAARGLCAAGWCATAIRRAPGGGGGAVVGRPRGW